MDVARDELLYSDVKGKNPFKDLRVRQALYQAIDIQAIHRTTMRGQSVVDRHALPRAGQRLRQGGGCAAALRRRAREGAAGRGRLSAGLQRDARLPEQPLHQRRADLPEHRRHVVARGRQDRGEVAAAGALLRADPARRHLGLPAGLGRADAGRALFLPVAAGDAATASRATASGITAAIPTRGWTR